MSYAENNRKKSKANSLKISKLLLGGGNNGELVLSGYRNSALQDKTVLEIYCTAESLWLTIQYCNLKNTLRGESLCQVFLTHTHNNKEKRIQI